MSSCRWLSRNSGSKGLSGGDASASDLSADFFAAFAISTCLPPQPKGGAATLVLSTEPVAPPHLDPLPGPDRRPHGCAISSPAPSTTSHRAGRAARRRHGGLPQRRRSRPLFPNESNLS